MESTIGFAEIAGAIIGAIGLALGLEWVALNSLMRLMPSESRPDARREGDAPSIKQHDDRGNRDASRNAPAGKRLPRT